MRRSIVSLPVVFSIVLQCSLSLADDPSCAKGKDPHPPDTNVDSGPDSEQALRKKVDEAMDEYGYDTKELREYKATLDQALQEAAKYGANKNLREQIQTARRSILRTIAFRSPRVRTAVDELLRHHPHLSKEFPSVEVPPTDGVKVTFPDPNATTPGEFTHTVNTEHGSCTLHFTRFSLYTPDAKILYPVAGAYDRDPANYKKMDIGPDRTYIGRVEGKPHWAAIAYMREDGSVRGLIYGDRQAGWLDFEGSEVAGDCWDHRLIKDSVFRYARPNLPPAGASKEPAYEVPFGMEMSFNEIVRANASVPTVLELMSIGQMELFFTCITGPRFHIPIKQLVLRTNLKGCPHARRFRNYDSPACGKGRPESMVLPEEFFPGLSAEERAIRGPTIIGEKLWPLIWPDHGCDKIIHLNFGAMAVWGGDVCTTHTYSLSESERFDKYKAIPCKYLYRNKTYIHEAAHMFHGDHFTGHEEGITVYGGGKPIPKRFPGSLVQHFRDHYLASKRGEFKVDTISYPYYKPHLSVEERKIRIKKDTDNIQVPPYACIDMVEIRGKQTTIDVTANDWDYNGHEVKLVSVEPSHWGGRTRIVDGKVVYTPPVGGIGTDRFKYRIADLTGWQATGYVVINLLPATTQTFDFTRDLDKTDPLNYAIDTHEWRGHKFFGHPVKFNSQAKDGQLGSEGHQTVTQQITVDKAGHYNLTLRYFIEPELKRLNVGISPRQIAMSVNGGPQRVKTFEVRKRRDEPSEWRTMNYYNIALNKGENAVTFFSMPNQVAEMAISEKRLRHTWNQNLPPCSSKPTMINSINIMPVSSCLVNFPGGSCRHAISAGSETFGKHDNGLEYGWSADGAHGFTDATARSKRGFKPGKWEMALPNGRYMILLQCPNSSCNDFMIEGVPFRDSNSPGVSDYIAKAVTISDRRLTVEVGPDAEGARVASIGISKIE